MAEQDLRNTSFYKELLQTAKEQGVITLLDIVLYSFIKPSYRGKTASCLLISAYQIL